MVEATHQSKLKGIFFMLGAMLTFVTINTISKNILTAFPVAQVTFFRNFFALLPCFLLLSKSGGFKTLKTKNLPRHLLLGIIGTLAMLALFSSLRALPLAEATTIHFTETLILTALAALYLKEKVGPHRWMAVVLGFIGVLIMARPTGDVLNIGAVYALLFAFGDAFYMTNARILTKEDSSAAIVIFFAFSVSLYTSFMLPFVWVQPTTGELMQLILLGIGGGLGQFFVTQAYRYADAATVAPMIYSALIWALLFGYLFWGEVPDTTLLVGGTLIVLSGLYIILREARKAQTITSEVPQGGPHDN